MVAAAKFEHKAHYLPMDLPHSDDCFVAAFPAETTEAFLGGHVRVFVYFGGPPTRILPDNTRISGRPSPCNC
jgi:transposase